MEKFHELHRVDLTLWTEPDDWIITVDDVPTGMTVSKEDGDVVAKWLDYYFNCP